MRYPNSAGQPGQYHAALWSGTAVSFTDLTPAEHPGAIIRGMAAGQLVGTVGNAIGQSAALWPSIGSAYIDLDPPGVLYADANATCGSAQVGVASTNQFGTTAVIWFGTAQSMTALAPFLGPGYRNSGATCVAEQDGVFYVGGYAVNISTGITEAVMWIGVPAPGPLPLLAAAALLATPRRRPR